MVQEVTKVKNSTGKSLYRTWKVDIVEIFAKDLNVLTVEENLDKIFKTLSLVKYEVENNAVAWRPPGNPVSLDMHEKLKTRKELKTLVQEKEARVQKLMAEVEARHSHVLDLETR